MDTEKTVDLDKEISDACDFMWPEKEGLSTREFANLVKGHLEEKDIKVTQKRILEYLNDIS